MAVTRSLPRRDLGLDDRRRRLLSAGLTIGILVGVVLGNAKVWPSVLDEIGADYGFFVGAARNWLATGSFYLPHQLAGPYVAQTAVDILYPPPALLLFIPFIWLPPPLWWCLPLGVIAAVVLLERPRYWFWPLLAVLLWLPRDESIVIWGNTAMWVAAFVALAVRLAWPSVLIAFKPTFLPFLFVGSRRRSWLLAAIVVGLSQLAVLPLWVDYVTAMRNNIGSWPGPFYSVPDYAFVSIPLIARLASSRRGFPSIPKAPRSSRTWNGGKSSLVG